MFTRMKDFGIPEIPEIPDVVYAVFDDGSIVALNTHEAVIYPGYPMDYAIRCTSNNIRFDPLRIGTSTIFQYYFCVDEIGKTVFFDFMAAVNAAKAIVEGDVSDEQ